MLRLFISLFTYTWLWGEAHGAALQDEPPSQSPEEATLAPVTVTATRVPTDISTVVNSFTLLDREALSASGKSDLSEVLRGYPGVSMLRNGGRGTLTSLFLRGASPAQSLLVVDGIPLYTATTGAFNFNALPVEFIDRVEIVRGPMSPLYGSQAMGGVIQLFTREALKNTTFLRLEGGSFGTLEESMGISRVGKLGRLTATATRQDLFEGTGAADPTQGNPERDGFQLTQGTLRLAVNPMSNLTVDGSLLYTRSRVEIDRFGRLPGGGFGALDDPEAFSREETWLAQTGARFTPASRWGSTVRFGFTQNRLDGKTELPFVITNRLFLAHWLNTHALPELWGPGRSLTLIWGGEVRQEQGENETRSFGDERRVVAGFAQAQADIGPWTGVAGVRVDNYEGFGTQPTFRLGAAWRITPRLKLRASGGTGFRAPSFNELAFPGFGNPDLEPEQSAGGDIGFDLRLTPRLSVSVNGFYNRFNNLIQAARDPATGKFTAQNVAQARTHGLEMEWAYHWGDGLSSGVDYTYIESQDQSTDKALPRRPWHQGRLWGHWQLSWIPLTLRVEGVYRGSHWDDSANTLKVKDALRVNAMASYQISRFLTVYLRGENLTDDRTPEIFGFGTPGAAVYGGVRLRW